MACSTMKEPSFVPTARIMLRANGIVGTERTDFQRAFHRLVNSSANLYQASERPLGIGGSGIKQYSKSYPRYRINAFAN